MSNTPNFEDRDPVGGVSELLIQRWSPRAFTNYDLPTDQLTRILDAARWAPSCFNEQPWTFFTSNESTFKQYLGLLVEANQTWAKNASVIGFLVGSKQFARNGKPNAWYALDCGAAWMSLTVQARVEGLYTHGLGGIKKDGVAEALGLDTETHEVLMGFVIGRVGDKAILPDDMQNNEKPSARKPLSNIWNPKK